MSSPRLSRREVRGVIKQACAVADGVAALFAVSERLRAKAVRILASLREREVAARLDELPIEDLRVSGRNARLTLLENAGFATAGAVLRAAPHQLTAIKGVGQQTVDAVKRAAGVAKAEVAADTRFRFEPDRPDRDQTTLLAVLTAMRASQAAQGRIGEAARELRTNAVRLAAAAKPAARLLARRSKREAGLAAVDEINELFETSRSTIEDLDVFTRSTDPASYSDEVLWRKYRDEAAAYNSLLSTLDSSGSADDPDAAHGHIGDERSRAVDAVELDRRLLTSTLRGYQEFGAKFALRQHRAIIGDEMGLGKTVQALAACAHLAAAGHKRFLVVAPASVLFNWLSEVNKHTRLMAHKLHGDDREDAGGRWLREGGVAVTTFDTLGRLRCLEGGPGPSMLIVDEAHYIKNPDTRRGKTVLRFIDRCDRVLFLSGTPMENRVAEFRNLVAYLRPNIAARIDATAGLAGARAFRRKVADVYLRRNQVDVLHELPGLIEVEEWVQFTSEDEKRYRQVLSQRADRGLLEQLRYAAYGSNDSAKLDRLLELVTEAIEDGQKVVVFSRFLDVLKRIRDGLSVRVTGTISGRVLVPKRQELIDEFTKFRDAAVLLCQIDTGGTGINLQAASVVIIAEPQWKPSTEQQAIARLHRMGQTRTVQVHRILAKASVDELLLEVQERKRLLFDEFARKSVAKDADRRAVDPTERPAVLDDESIPLELRVVLAEQFRTVGNEP